MRTIASDAETGAATPHFHAFFSVTAHNDARVVPSRNPWHRRLEMPGHVFYIAWIDARCFDLDQYIALGRLRIGKVREGHPGRRLCECRSRVVS